MFQMSDEEFSKWKSQTVISNSEEATIRMGLRKRPFVFTEHGVAMLASVLRSSTAVRVSIAVVEAFVAMRRFVTANAEVFQRIDLVEKRQIATDAKVDEILLRLDKNEQPTQGLFFDGQLRDARSLVEKLIAKAKKTILLVDNWVGPSTLDMLAKKRPGVNIEIVTSEHRDRRGNPRPTLAATDIANFNAQYPSLSIRYSEHFHDRFLILDDKELYLIGASLKDLGKKCFAFTRLDLAEIPNLKARI